MLHKKTVERNTFELLRQLMEDPKLKNFSLAGGTALSLYLGHRKSIDLDLFQNTDFSTSEISQHMEKNYNFKVSSREENTLKGFVNKVKVDCITHKYPNINPINNINGIRLYSIEDIAAMKLNAIADNGTRLKDFVDIAYLSTKLTLNQMLESYQEKYKNSNAMRAVRGLIYQCDIIHEPISLINAKYEWKDVSRRIEEMINNDTKIFTLSPFKTSKEINLEL